MSASEDFLRIEGFKEVFQPLLPRAEFAGKSFAGDSLEETLNFNAHISTENIFQDSIYELKDVESFIHFTSLQGIFSVLNSGYFRMSEFGHLEDKREILYGASVFGVDPIFNFNYKSIEDLKRNIFCFSSCIANENTKKNNYMWHIYANKRNGGFIEFEMNPWNPFFYNIGKVLYGKKGLAPLESLKDRAIDFYNKNNFFPERFIELMLDVQALHKSEKYSSEEEIRIIYKIEDNPFGDIDTVYRDINSQNELKKFNKLYIDTRNPYLKNKNPEQSVRSILYYYPSIKIKNITLGIDIHSRDKREILDELKKYQKEYEFSISYIDEENDIHSIG